MLKKENNFVLDVDQYINFVKVNNPDTVVIINPNNPDGGYIGYQELKKIIRELKDVKNIIQFMKSDKKKTDSKIKLILISKIGKALKSKSLNDFILKNYLNTKLF